MFSLLRRLRDAIIARVGGRLVSDQDSSQLALLDDDEVPGELPIGTPVVFFSERAREMQTAARRYNAEQRDIASKEKAVKGPRAGSREWRIAEAKAGR